MLIEKFLPQRLSTMAKEQADKRTTFRIVARFIRHTPIFFQVSMASAVYWGIRIQNSPPFMRNYLDSCQP